MLAYWSSSVAVVGTLRECARGQFAKGSCIVCTIGGSGFNDALAIDAAGKDVARSA